MNTKKILLSVLICLVMVAALCLSVACNQEIKLDLSDAEQWAPAVSEGEEDIYRASKDSDGNLVLDFAKNDTYNATKTTFDAFKLDDIAKVKTIVITAKMTTDAPYPALLFKVEGSDDPAAAEVKVKATADYTTYEWDFAGYDLTKVVRFLIFADPGVAGSSGKITIKEIYLTDKAVNADNDANNKPAEVGVAPAPVWNEVTASKMSIGNWVDGTANNVYTVTAEGTSYKVDVHKKIGAGNWDALISYIHGDALATAKSFKLVVKGTKDKQILVKPFDNFEKRVTLTGDNQEIIIDVSSFTADAAKDYSKKDAPTAENKVCIMGVPDTNKGNDTFTIISAEFSTEAAAPVVDNSVNEITAENHKITKGWEGLDAGTYTVTADGTALKVVYKVSDYKFLRTYVKGEEIANMKTVVFTVEGTAGDKILCKAFGKEERFTLTGDKDVIIVDISANLAGVTLTEKQEVLICAAPGAAEETTGEFKLISVEFSANEAAVDPNLNTITNANKAITKWYPEDVNKDKFALTSNQNGTTTVVKTGTGWQQLKADVKGADIANFALLRVKLSGVKNLPFVVRCWDGKEYFYDGREVDGQVQAIPTTDDVIVEVKVPAGDYTVTKTLVVFLNVNGANDEATCTVTISAEFGNPLNEITSENTAVTKWYGDKNYAFVENNDGSVSVTKSNGGWTWFKADVSGADLANMKTFTIVLEDLGDNDIIVKPFDKLEAKIEHKEGGVVDVVGTVATKDGKTTITFDLTKVTGVSFDGTLQIICTFDFNNKCGNNDATFKIVSAEFSTEEAPAPEAGE